MGHRRVRLIAIAIATCISPGAWGQSPLPSIDPAQARLDETITSLDGAACAEALNPDFEVLAVATDRGSIQLWERDVLYGIRRGARTPYAFQGHAGPITALATRGRYLASTGADKKLSLWSVPEGKALASSPTENILRSLAFAPDGQTLAAGGEDGTISLVEVPGLRPLGKLSGHEDWITALQFRPDGKQLAAGANDGEVAVWNLDTRQQIVSFSARVPAAKDQPPADNTALALLWSLDGETLAVGGTDKRIHFYRAADGEYLRSLTGHTGAVTALAYYPDGSMLASASKDRTVRLWRMSDAQALKALEGHAAWVEGTAFLARGTRLATVGADHTLRIWDLSAPKK